MQLHEHYLQNIVPMVLPSQTFESGKQNVEFFTKMVLSTGQIPSISIRFISPFSTYNFILKLCQFNQIPLCLTFLFQSDKSWSPPDDQTPKLSPIRLSLLRTLSHQKWSKSPEKSRQNSGECNASVLDVEAGIGADGNNNNRQQAQNCLCTNRKGTAKASSGNLGVFLPFLLTFPIKNGIFRK
jgi:hypothetical protein